MFPSSLWPSLNAIMMSGVAVAILAVIPGMPVFALLIISSILIGGGFYLSKRIKEEPSIISSAVYQGRQSRYGTWPGGTADAAAAKPVTEEEYYKDVSNVYTLLTVEPIEMKLATSLIPLADESVGGRLISRIVIFRRQIRPDMGFVIDPSALETVPDWEPTSTPLKSREKR